jgi:hypothetical protein
MDLKRRHGKREVINGVRMIVNLIAISPMFEVRKLKHDQTVSSIPLFGVPRFCAIQ